MLAALFCLTSPVFLVATFKVWSDPMAAALIAAIDVVADDQTVRAVLLRAVIKGSRALVHF